MSRPRVAPLVLSSLIACGDAGSADNGGSSDTTASTGPAPTTTAGSNPTTSIPDTTTAATTSGTTDATTGDPPPPMVMTEVVRYTAQPMVVDVVVTTGAPTRDLQVSHPDDPGVVAEPIAVDESLLTTTFRVRGLAPDTLHTLHVDADGAHESFELLTYPPLPGFVPAFTVEGSSDPAAPYRMFDMIPFPAFDTASVFMVDAAGTTRWHLGGPSTGVPGPEGVWTSVRLRDDGTIMFLHDHTMYIRDELGTTLLEIPDDMLGVTGLHHEIVQLPGGNYLALAFSFRDVDYGVAGVLETAGDLIVEFTPEAEVVWTWDSFDHLDPQRVTEPFDVHVVHPLTAKNTYDWTHGNAVVHDPATDTLLLSLRHQDWIVAIDHATGEVLWKLGRDGDFAFVDDAYFHHQHAPEWQPDGTLLLYDNGVANPDLAPADEHSRVVRYALDFDAMTAERVYVDDGEPVTATFAGNADRLPSGRYFASDSAILGPAGIWSRLRELDPDASPDLQWSLRTPDATFVYRATAHDRIVGRAAP